MKKIIGILVAILVVVGMTGCSFDNNTETANVETNHYDIAEEVISAANDFDESIMEMMNEYDELVKESYEEYGNGRSYEEFYEDFYEEFVMSTY